MIRLPKAILLAHPCPMAVVKITGGLGSSFIALTSACHALVGVLPISSDAQRPQVLTWLRGLGSGDVEAGSKESDWIETFTSHVFLFYI